MYTLTQEPDLDRVWTPLSYDGVVEDLIAGERTTHWEFLIEDRIHGYTATVVPWKWSKDSPEWLDFHIGPYWRYEG